MWVNESLIRNINAKPQANQISQKQRLEEYIKNILNPFDLSPHMMDSSDIADAYAECGELNLEIANL